MSILMVKRGSADLLARGPTYTSDRSRNMGATFAAIAALCCGADSQHQVHVIDMRWSTKPLCRS